MWELAWLKSHEPSARGPSRQYRAVAAVLAREKIYYNPHPYGLDSLWFGFIVAWILFKIVEWSIEQNHVQFTVFNMFLFS